MMNLNSSLMGREDSVEAPDYGFSARNNARAKYNMKKWAIRILLGVLIFIPYVCIIVLFSKVGESETNYYSNNPTGVFSSSQYVSSSLRSSQSNSNTPTIVSFTDTGSIQPGAGTSIYVNQSTLTLSCPSYIDVDAIFDSSYLVSSTNEKESKGIISVVQVSDSNEIQVLKSNTINYNLYQVATLNQQSGLIVFITQDLSETSNTGFVVAANAEADGSLTQGTALGYTSDTYSVSPSIIRLSDTSFAISYYVEGSSFLATRYGTVDPKTLQITLSPSQKLMENYDFSLVSSIAAVSSSDYVIGYYYSNSSSIPESVSTTAMCVTSTPLSVLYIHYDSASLSFQISTTSVTLENACPTSVLSSLTLSSNGVVFTFADALLNQGLRTVLLAIDSTSDSSTTFSFPLLFFASSLVLTSGASLTTLPNLLTMDLDMAPLTVSTTTSSYSYVVLFTDFANQLAVTALVVEVTSSRSLLHGSPSYVLQEGNYNSWGNDYSWTAVASVQTLAHHSQSLLLSAQTPTTSCNSALSQINLSVMESLPSAAGLTWASLSSSPSASVLMEGSVIAGFSSANAGIDMNPGKVYFTNTRGELQQSSLYWGAPITGMDVSSNAAVRIENTLYSPTSRVGVALSSDSLLLK